MNWKRWIFRLLILLAVGALGYWLGHHAGEEKEEGEGKGPVAHVTLAPIQKKMIAENVTTYGSVVAQPGKSRAVAATFETRVRHVLVAPGETVTAGQPLVEIDPSPAAQLQLAQAKSTAEAAQKELDQTQQRFNLKLATNQDLGLAKKAAESAQLQLQSLQKQGVSSEGRITSEMAGLIGKVDVQDGQIVQAGSPLVELIARDDIEVKLGVEPEDVRYMKPDQSLSLFVVNVEGAKPVEGKIRLITERVNPETRMVDVYVTVPSGANLMLDAYLRAEIKTLAHETMVVPRSAVLPKSDGKVVFTVQKDHAVEHSVQTGLQTNKETEIIASDLKPGDEVVVQGNYELSDGMAVATGKKL
ncbi:MAG: efflux RND transporter periplasmic adaptor subunit [Verrucomicrobiota bacterium]|nr:efflux RND transporter periplasmic adaptor subunit [Verrucomicrobiota bacterium]